MTNKNEIIRVENIDKHFGGVHALNGVSVSINRGEIHALVGENGAGKSTLMKILAGVYHPDSGKIILRGEDVSFADPRAAQKKGISIVFQELNLFPALNVYRNIFVNREVVKKSGLFDVRYMREVSNEIITKIGIEISPDEKVSSLSTAERQIVEIARALSQESDIIIMDEPNSALGETETRLLFKTLNTLRKEGLTIIYVSHRLEEVFEIADRITVLRDGSLINSHEVKDTNIPEIISEMIGRTLKETFPEREYQQKNKKTLLRVNNISKEGILMPLSFDLREGEILGIAGLEGCGKEVLFQILFGLKTKTSGEITFNGKLVNHKKPLDVIKKGWSLIPADRRKQGVMINWPIISNVILVILDRITNMAGLIKTNKADSIVNFYIDSLKISTDSLKKKVNKLSGGNQQKIVLAKWLSTDPKFLLLDDPTRGIDVGTKTEVYKLMDQLANDGLPILFTSSEIDEIIGMSDRIIVLHKGEKVYECERGHIEKQELLHYVNSGYLANNNRKEPIEVENV